MDNDAEAAVRARLVSEVRMVLVQPGERLNWGWWPRHSLELWSDRLVWIKHDGSKGDLHLSTPQGSTKTTHAEKHASNPRQLIVNASGSVLHLEFQTSAEQDRWAVAIHEVLAEIERAELEKQRRRKVPLACLLLFAFVLVAWFRDESASSCAGEACLMANASAHAIARSGEPQYLSPLVLLERFLFYILDMVLGGALSLAFSYCLFRIQRFADALTIAVFLFVVEYVRVVLLGGTVSLYCVALGFMLTFVTVIVVPMLVFLYEFAKCLEACKSSKGVGRGGDGSARGSSAGSML